VITLAAASTSTSAWDEPGTLGFLVVFGMGVILYFVFRSMAKHLRKVRQAAWQEAQQAQQAQRVQQAQSSSRGSGDSEPDTEYDRQQREANAIDLDF
jgi:Sec-independent protein translocase protein TatA